jgi:hypothetical protein
MMRVLSFTSQCLTKKGQKPVDSMVIVLLVSNEHTYDLEHKVSDGTVHGDNKGGHPPATLVPDGVDGDVQDRKRQGQHNNCKPVFRIRSVLCQSQVDELNREANKEEHVNLDQDQVDLISTVHS